jgi:quercetin dioxygenase-like cupin family protein
MSTAELLHGRNALTQLFSLEAQEIDALPWEDVPACAGVHQKVLWRLGGFAQALLRYEPAATTPGFPHLAAHHHIWVVSGTVTIAERRLGAGSYLHVPPGVGHAASAGDDGCVLLQMHRPHPPTEADLLVGMS